MKKLNYFFISMILTFISQASFAQEQAMSKHPKVIEMEMMISKQAMNFLQQRIPNEPVYVNVELEPLRRNSVLSKDEQLPYFYSEDEVGDEWDVLDTPLVLLLSRIKKATIKVEVPNHITDIELMDLKEKLFEQLKLIPVRDSITIERKDFVAKPSSEAKDFSLYYFVSAMALLTFMGLFFVLKHGVKNSQPGTATAASHATTAPSMPPTPMRSHGNSGKSNIQGFGAVNSKVNGDINFKDSLRASDLLKEKLHGVINAPIFPLLSDLLILEDLSNKSLSSFGAFVFEMPRKHQQKVFFRGRTDRWFRGYIEAASVDMDCLLSVEKMLRNRTASGSEKWEELLVQIWRLGDEAHLFLKQIPSDEAFMILAYLPKAYSVPMARKSFPGAWARILESKENKPIEDETKLDDYLNRTIQLKPYFSFKSIDDYKKDLELVDYLKQASIKDEEDIYESLNTESQIHVMRPPFYLIFKANEDDFKNIFLQFDLSDWAAALINSPREYLKLVTSGLDDKKRYLFSSYLKQLDENPIPAIEQMELREQMAKQFRENKLSKKLKTDSAISQENDDNRNEIKDQAA